VVAWLLTEEPANNVVDNQGAGHSNSIWTVRQEYSLDLVLSVQGEIGIIESNQAILQVYNTRTGEVLEPTNAPPRLNVPQYFLTETWAWDRLCGGSICNSPPHDSWEPSQSTLKEGWMKDCEGKCLLWLPVEWRPTDQHEIKWSSEAAIIGLIYRGHDTLIVKLY
jgi:hypothetical protein